MSKKKNNSTPLISYERKMEMLGIIIIAIAASIAISIITYRSEDFAIIQSVSFRTLMDLGQGPALRIQNGLGPLGAYMSHFFVHILFGYISMILVVIMLSYGWNIFRHNALAIVHLKSLYAVFVMILSASIMGWVHNEFDAVSADWAGSSGVAIAYLLRGLTGQYGPVIILGSMSLIALILLFNKDVQSAFDRIRQAGVWFGSIFSSSASANEDPEERDAASVKQVRDSAQEKGSDGSRNQKNGTEEDEDSRRKRWEELVSSSSEREQARKLKEQKETGETRPPRAILSRENRGDDGAERGSSGKNEPGDDQGADGTAEAGEQDVDIRIYKGTPEEEAGKRKLEKERKKQLEKPQITYRFPALDLLDKAPEEDNEVDYEEINRNKMIILDKLNRHGIDITAIEAIVGPTVTLYELQPAPDVKISKIESYANDLKMAMATKGLRIIAPIPGKSAVGIEVPNRKKETVYIRSLINTRKFAETSMKLPVAFGRTIENEVFMVDLARLPHLLMAGATGSGKTVGINTIITCLLYKCHPDDLKFVMVDPKKIELSLFRNIQNHFLATLPNATEPIITDTAEVLQTLNSVCKEMDERYDLLKMATVRDITSYNEKFKEGSLDNELGHRHLPYIVVIIDELADLMMTAGKQIEEPIARLAQLARAVGIHLVIATQRPSVNVITGTIKANFPARVAYRVASKIDSRTILDTMGADQLVGRGDMLYNSGGVSMVRLQNAFVSTEEVDRINEFIGNQTGYDRPYYLPETEDPNDQGGSLEKGERDELFEEAAKVLVLHQQGSVSLLQRKLKLGYNRAGRLIDQLFTAGIVGPYQGSTAREVLVENEDELQELLNDLDN
ncbi:FtsK/SpoIIIE family DNA translocase [Natronogracilivirga saccharolytica]|uniref:DNA translocase FtsK 4TM domain-containing protein n=1 Tax=Natronogracilivirga saccharolytica TaxID=2812953 RepID=A0A8J7S7G8_9BACT|nr:DNA translocase FtsK [Natronogracilivirga saccharolytica]MBP3191546.1 DNA translocase FtsK 4TM domain-containing protein [Natronogracilivirga saccharolytica]